MLKPVRFLKPRAVNGPLYQAGDVAGFMPELVAELVADGSVCEISSDEASAPIAAEPAPEKTVPVSGYPYATADERQAARASGKKGKR